MKMNRLRYARPGKLPTQIAVHHHQHHHQTTTVMVPSMMTSIWPVTLALHPPPKGEGCMQMIFTTTIETPPLRNSNGNRNHLLQKKVKVVDLEDPRISPSPKYQHQHLWQNPLQHQEVPDLCHPSSFPQVLLPPPPLRPPQQQ